MLAALVDRLARPDQAVPRARLIGVGRVASGEMVAAGVAMRAQDGVAAAIWSIGRREPGLSFRGTSPSSLVTTKARLASNNRRLLWLQQHTTPGCGRWLRRDR